MLVKVIMYNIRSDTLQWQILNFLFDSIVSLLYLTKRLTLEMKVPAQ